MKLSFILFRSLLICFLSLSLFLCLTHVFLTISSFGNCGNTSFFLSLSLSLSLYHLLYPIIRNLYFKNLFLVRKSYLSKLILNFSQTLLS